MQIYNPLVPPQLGTPGGAPAPVANAPNVPDSTKRETSRPVTSGNQSDRARSEGERPRAEGRGGNRTERRGEIVDVSV